MKIKLLALFFSPKSIWFTKNKTLVFDFAFFFYTSSIADFAKLMMDDKLDICKKKFVKFLNKSFETYIYLCLLLSFN